MVTLNKYFDAVHLLNFLKSSSIKGNVSQHVDFISWLHNFIVCLNHSIFHVFHRIIWTTLCAIRIGEIDHVVVTKMQICCEKLRHYFTLLLYISIRAMVLMIAIVLFDDIILLYWVLGTKSSLFKNFLEPKNLLNISMNILIPAAGLGTRFKESHDSPKNMIDVKGDPMLVAAVKSLGLNKDGNQFIFLLPEDMLDDTHNLLGTRLQAEFPGCKVLVVVGQTEGAAQTAIQAHQYIENDEELLIANCDQIMHWDDKLRDDVFEKLREFEAGIICLESDDPKHSYLDLVTGAIFEKEVQAGNMALTGLHYFKKGSDFITSTRLMMQSGMKSQGEYYIGPVYNWFEGEAGFYQIESKDISFIGTPQDLADYLEK